MRKAGEESDEKPYIGVHQAGSEHRLGDRCSRRAFTPAEAHQLHLLKTKTIMNKNIYKIIGVVVASVGLLYITFKYFLPVLVGTLAVIGLLTIAYLGYQVFVDKVTWKGGLQ